MKKLLSLAFALTCAVSLRADFLWWDVGTNADNGLNDFIESIGDNLTKAGGCTSDDVFVHLCATDGSTKKVLSDVDGVEWVWIPGQKDVKGDDSGIQASSSSINLSQLNLTEPSDITAWSFYVEVVCSKGNEPSATDKVMGESVAVSYGDLYSAGAVTTALSPMDGYMFSSYVVPEPTSALMLLLGMGALALRRRRV